VLVSFAIKNFRSFYRETHISLVPNGRLTQLEGHVLKAGDTELLRGAYVYGANASGKTNLVKAADFARSVIVAGSTRHIRYAGQYCKLYEEAGHEPGVFQFEIVVGRKVYSYGFALSYQNGNIVEEWLYELGDRGLEKCIFARDEQNQIITDLNLKGKLKTRFEIYCEDLKSLPGTLFLAEIVRKPLRKELEVFSLVYEWFKDKLIVIFPASKYMALPTIIHDEEVRKKFEKYLTYFDTGIESMGTGATTLEKELAHLPSDFAEDIRQDIMREMRELEGETCLLRGPGVLLALRRKDDKSLLVQKLTMKHGVNSEDFDLEEESDGTQRLFDLVPLLFGEQENRVVFIDEIDRNMHPSLTVELVKLFYRQTKPRNMQLIATTHESALLDLKLIRRDEVWFVERQAGGSSLFSLDDFKVRYDKKIEKDYLLGRYGAVPLFSAADFLSSRVSEND